MKKRNISGLSVCLCLVLVFYCITLILPMVWALFTAVKEQYDFLDYPLDMPKKFVFENFRTVLEEFEVNAFVNVDVDGETILVQEKHDFGQMLINTLLYVGGSAFAATLIPCITAYVCAKFPKKKMSGIIYAIVIATAKRARQLIAGAEPMNEKKTCPKALSIAVEEVFESKVKIIPEEKSEQ